MKRAAQSAEKPIRICVATSYGATEEPRGPRYAAELDGWTLASRSYLWIACPGGHRTKRPPNSRIFQMSPAARGVSPGAAVADPLALEKVRQHLARQSFRRDGSLNAAALSTRVIGLERMLIEERADLYFGFNIDTLLPVWHAAQIKGVPFMFDCHEIHAEMAYDQSELERSMIRAIQARCLPAAALVLAAGPQAAEYIERDVGIRDVVPLLNAAPLTDIPPRQPTNEFRLYWRNSSLDISPRGLGDILRAMPLLPADITLYLQGRPALDGQSRMENLIRELGIGNRVVILPPYRLRDAVITAVPYTIGLTLESPLNTNLNLSTSNKFFEYAMAGLAIVSTPTEGLRHLIAAADLASHLRIRQPGRSRAADPPAP